MAFSIQGWGRLSSGNMPVVTLQDGTRAGAPNIFTYTTSADLQAAIGAANYFAPVVVELNIGDLIYAVDSANTPEQWMVTAVNVTAKTVTVTNAAPAAGDVVGTPPTALNQIARYTDATGLVIKGSNLYLSDTDTLTNFAAGDISINAGTAANNGLAVQPNGNGDPGILKLWNAAFTHIFGIQAGANAADTIYTAPVAFPAANGYALTSTTAGVMSWTAIPDSAWVDAGATPVNMVANTSYIADAGAQQTFNVPAVVARGTVFKIAGNNGGNFIVQMNAGQTLHIASGASSVAGTATATNQYDEIEILCTVANTTFTVIGAVGTFVLA